MARQDGAVREGVLGLVTQLGLEAIVLPAAPEAAEGTFIERLDVLRDADYAIVVLCTAESASDLSLEMGFLLGAIGRDRIGVVLSGKLAPPWDGIESHLVDEAGLWRLWLAREMRRAGLDVDMNRAL